jgi:hypothetical protein
MTTNAPLIFKDKEGNLRSSKTGKIITFRSPPPSPPPAPPPFRRK